jgi:cytochrome c oxidase cbb3-type subunit 3
MPRVYGGRGGGLQGVTVTLTQPDGQKIEGKLGRLDDFIVTLTDSTGTVRSFDRDHDQPKVEVHDPMQPHRDLLPKYTDKDIHDVTAWMVTLK